MVLFSTTKHVTPGHNKIETTMSEQTFSDVKMYFSGLRAAVKLLFLVALVMPLSGSPVRESSIDNPCNRDPTSTGPETFQPLSDLLSNAAIYANQAKTKSRAVQELLVNSNLLISDEVAWLDSLVDAIPELPLSIEEVPDSIDNMTNFLLSNYKELSIFIVHLELVEDHQIAYDYGKMLNEIKAVKEEFYKDLCIVETILRSRNVLVTEFVDSSDVAEWVKSMGTDGKNRHYRTYLCMKYAIIYLSSFTEGIAELKEMA